MIYNAKQNGIDAAKSTRRRRDLHAMFGGRCFYCGIHVQLCSEDALPRDWLMLKGPTRMMVEDHAHPKKRGGEDGIDNRKPACWSCNIAKGWLTVDEYRLRLGLKHRNFNISFACEEPRIERDWLCVYSQDREIFVHNVPWAADAYSRSKPIRKRGTTRL